MPQSFIKSPHRRFVKGTKFPFVNLFKGESFRLKDGRRKQGALKRPLRSQRPAVLAAKPRVMWVLEQFKKIGTAKP